MRALFNLRCPNWRITIVSVATPAEPRGDKNKKKNHNPEGPARHLSGGRGCLEEGRLGVPGQVWEFRFLPSFPSFPRDNRSSRNVWENAWKSQTPFFQTSGLLNLDVSGQKLSPHCLQTIFDAQLPSPKLSPEMLPKLSLPLKRRLFFLSQITPAARVIARQLRSRHQDVSSGPLGRVWLRIRYASEPVLIRIRFPF